VDYLRKYGRLALWDPQTFPEGENPEDGPEEALLQREKAEHLAGSLARLSPEHAQVLRLREEDLSYADMGNILGKPLGQVKILLYRARKALRKIMEEGEA
jgi:RNA polymerase sigma-70 factor (ECF subfamily)